MGAIYYCALGWLGVGSAHTAGAGCDVCPCVRRLQVRELLLAAVWNRQEAVLASDLASCLVKGLACDLATDLSTS